jgi:hypothetical protein
MACRGLSAQDEEASAGLLPELRDQPRIVMPLEAMDTLPPADA